MQRPPWRLSLHASCARSIHAIRDLSAVIVSSMGVLQRGVDAAVAESGHEVCEGSSGLRCKNLARVSEVVDADVCSPHVSQRFGNGKLRSSIDGRRGTSVYFTLRI